MMTFQRCFLFSMRDCGIKMLSDNLETVAYSASARSNFDLHHRKQLMHVSGDRKATCSHQLLGDISESTLN